MHAIHLARRFFASVFARPLNVEEDAWVAAALTSGEREVWLRQPRYDLRHTYGVAKRVDEALGEKSESRWIAAALLHDVGKVESGLGIAGRVIATLVLIGLGRRRIVAWQGRTGWQGRFGRYAAHGPIGADLIRTAGGRPEPARWAEIHHRPNADNPGTGFDLPQEVVVVLRDSDRD